MSTGDGTVSDRITMNDAKTGNPTLHLTGELTGLLNDFRTIAPGTPTAKLHPLQIASSCDGLTSAQITDVMRFVGAYAPEGHSQRAQIEKLACKRMDDRLGT
jgi:hypothetical protein